MLRSIGFAVMSAFAVTAWAQDKVDLKWKFEAGKTFYQTVNIDSRQTMKITVGGQPPITVPNNSKQTMVVAWTPLRQEGGGWAITEKITAVRVEMEAGGQKIRYDSADPNTKSGPIAPIFNAMVGAEVVLFLNDKLKVSKVQGVKELLDRLTAGQPPQLRAVMEQSLNENTFRQLSDSAFGVLPARAVGMGDTWTLETNAPLGGLGNVSAVNTMTYQGREAALHKIGVTGTMKYSPPAAGAPGALPFRIKEGDLKARKIEGTVMFDSALGRLASGKVAVSMEGKLTIEVQGMTGVIELEQEQSTGYTISDTDPTKKP